MLILLSSIAMIFYSNILDVYQTCMLILMTGKKGRIVFDVCFWLFAKAGSYILDSENKNSWLADKSFISKMFNGDTLSCHRHITTVSIPSATNISGLRWFGYCFAVVPIMTDKLIFWTNSLHTVLSSAELTVEINDLFPL